MPSSIWKTPCWEGWYNEKEEGRKKNKYKSYFIGKMQSNKTSVMLT